MEKNYIRRSINIPISLDEKVSRMAKDYYYKNKQDLILELLELGIIKFNEDMDLKNNLNRLINRVDVLINEIESK